ncbi:MAG TPA: hypothetical protein PKU87_02865 [Candidatus Atribacteria bacterium]|nr:hypothetical protein [Candidatus Atribacteria bacterium]HPU08862.1 hypothetical protein [Candidatus Atribacteria bacterium]HQE25009.1 hypothetical protein [Candidatus Atribacteria bacterium]
MEKEKLAEAFSLVLQPSAIAVLLYLVVSFSFATGWQAWLFFLIGLVFMGLLPIWLMFFLTKKGKISDPDLSNREERFFPYLMVCGFYFLALVIFLLTSAPLPLVAITCCYLGVTLVGAIVSLFWKISLHLAGIAGPVTALVMIISPYWAFLYLLLLPLGWARIYLGKHNVYQVVAGSVMSIVITFIIVSNII